jgi:hypothetical protein
MPVVIAQKVGQCFFVDGEEGLAVILGHSDFDGYPFRVGDLVVFEDETVARIENEPGRRFHTWSTAVSRTIREVIEHCRSIHAEVPIRHELGSLKEFCEALSCLPEPTRRLFRRRWTRG